jgi:hypothetical protein
VLVGLNTRAASPNDAPLDRPTRGPSVTAPSARSVGAAVDPWPEGRSVRSLCRRSCLRTSNAYRTEELTVVGTANCKSTAHDDVTMGRRPPDPAGSAATHAGQRLFGSVRVLLRQRPRRTALTSSPLEPLCTSPRHRAAITSATGAASAPASFHTRSRSFNAHEPHDDEEPQRRREGRSQHAEHEDGGCDQNDRPPTDRVGEPSRGQRSDRGADQQQSGDQLFVERAQRSRLCARRAAHRRRHRCRSRRAGRPAP